MLCVSPGLVIFLLLMEKGLNLLSKAPTKKSISELFSLCYRNRHQPISQNEKTQVAALLKIEVVEAVEVTQRRILIRSDLVGPGSSQNRDHRSSVL